MARKTLASLALAALVAVLAATQITAASAQPAGASAWASVNSGWKVWRDGETPPTPRRPGNPAPTDSIVLTDQTWTCSGPVNLDSVTVTMTPAAAADRSGADAIHLRPGCTGRIGRINVTQYAADGLKVAEGVHDLTIGGGFIRCLAKGPDLHQDGAQIMGGERITITNLTIDCGRAGEKLINSNLFIKQAGQSANPPTDVVCDHCTFGANTAHTVSIQGSIRSGITNSTVCNGKYPKLTLTIGAEAQAPVNSGNTVGGC